jgi:hypothetical protein
MALRRHLVVLVLSMWLMVMIAMRRLVTRRSISVPRHCTISVDRATRRLPVHWHALGDSSSIRVRVVVLSPHRVRVQVRLPAVVWRMLVQLVVVVPWPVTGGGAVIGV